MYSKSLILLYFLPAFAFTYVRGIINGDEAQLGQFPYAVAIFTTTQVHWCGGGIIGDKWILSAAACFTNINGHFYDNTWFEVHANMTTNDYTDIVAMNTIISIPVEAVYIPKEYDSNTDQANIAVLKLTRSLDFGKSGLQQLCIPSGDHNFYEVGVQAKVMGFGESSVNRNGSYNFDLKLRSANVHIVDDAIHYRLDKHHFLAKMTKPINEVYGICMGDVGSPLVYKSAMILGVAFQPAIWCDEREHPAIYTKVAPYLNFIRNAVKDVIRGIRVKRY